jgi:hypothetical protein
MKMAILHTLAYEKSKVEQITNGKNYKASNAPLADENGMLPCGIKATAGGPLDRLQHIKATMLHMADVLDTIVKHIQKDPSARYLFKDDDEKSETPTIIVDQQNDKQTSTDEDITMHQRDSSGVKRLFSNNKSPHCSKQITLDETENHATPQKSPPSKRERATKDPSAVPDHNRERRET